MYLTQDDKVCTMLQLSGFKEGSYGDSWENPRALTKREPTATSLSDFKEQLKTCIKNLTNEYYSEIGDFGAWATVLAVTSKLQPEAAKHLKNLGFEKINEFKSGKYPNTPTTYWIISVEDLMEELNIVNTYTPELEQDDGDIW